MTTATFVPETDEFDMHTPCLEATKWWIGDLVRTRAMCHISLHPDRLADASLRGTGCPSPHRERQRPMP